MIQIVFCGIDTRFLYLLGLSCFQFDDVKIIYCNARPPSSRQFACVVTNLVSLEEYSSLRAAFSQPSNTKVADDTSNSAFRSNIAKFFTQAEKMGFNHSILQTPELPHDLEVGAPSACLSEIETRQVRRSSNRGVLSYAGDCRWPDPVPGRSGAGSGPAAEMSIWLDVSRSSRDGYGAFPSHGAGSPLIGAGEQDAE